MKRLLFLLAPVVALSVAACSSDTSSTGGGKTVVEPIGTPLITASAASPLTTETVTFSIGVTGGALQKGLLVWSDNCRGEFFAQSGTEVTWQNKWAEDCEIKAELYAAEPSAAAAAATDATAESLFTTPAAMAVTSVTTKYAPGTIETIAGSGCSQNSGYTSPSTGDYDRLFGEGGPATQAAFGRPYDVIVSPSGEIYFTDREGGRVLKVDADGILRRVAGTVAGGRAGSSAGDGGAATAAGFEYPIGLAFNSKGDLYVTEVWNNTIRMIYASSGTIYTRITGLNGPFGLAIDAADNLYFANIYGNAVRKAYAGPLTTSQLAGALTYVAGIDITADGKTVYGAVRHLNQVVKIDADTGTKTVVAGTGTAGYTGDGGLATAATLREPFDVHLDRSTGELYVADAFNKAIRKIGKDGKIKTVVGPGVGTYPGDRGVAVWPFDSPVAVTLDGEGNLLVADRDACQILKVVGPL